MKRVALVMCSVVSALALATGSAWACTGPNIVGWGPSGPNSPVHPGDAVTYTITDMSAGAEYRVYVGSQPVTDPLTASDSGPRTGTFTMPDLGGATRDVSLETEIHHGDIDTPDQSLRPHAASPLRYTVAASPATQDSPQPQSQAPSAADGASDQSQVVTAAPPTAPSAGGHTVQGPTSPTSHTQGVAHRQRPARHADRATVRARHTL